jgi:hypothetical protein
MDTHQKDINTALLICVPYLIIVFFLDDLDKLFYLLHINLGNPLLVLYLFANSIVIITFLLNSILGLKTNVKTNGSRVLVPLLIYIIAVINSFWSPIRLSSEVFKSNIRYRAYRKEKYGHALMKLRQDGSMDIRYPALLGMSGWDYGRWSGRGDTFCITLDRSAGDSGTDTFLLSHDGTLAPLGVPQDTIEAYRSQLFKMAVDKK